MKEKKYEIWCRFGQGKGFVAYGGAYSLLFAVRTASELIWMYGGHAAEDGVGFSAVVRPVK
jgi:hypothetical protein